MRSPRRAQGISRRQFFKITTAAACYPLLYPVSSRAAIPFSPSKLFWITDIPEQPFLSSSHPDYHAGVESLLRYMSRNKLKFYRSPVKRALSGPKGLISPQDVVLLKVNAQWKYRGCTNSDLVRGLIQRILDHPDGFAGEVVILENGQGRGSLNCDTASGYPDGTVHANANDEAHSFLYLVDHIFADSRLSAYLLDPIRGTFIGPDDHITEGYRIWENVSYPCLTTARGTRVELMKGIWQGSGYSQDLKLINIPVLKHHDSGGSEITASLKHLYGVLSMGDGQSAFRHYAGLGATCGKMVVSVRTPVLNIIDATWVSHGSLTGYPASTTFRANQLLASQDPVALDYWGAKYVLYRIDNNPRHHPTFTAIDQWLTAARDIINSRGGLYDPESGIKVSRVTKDERRMSVVKRKSFLTLA